MSNLFMLSNIGTKSNMLINTLKLRVLPFIAVMGLSACANTEQVNTASMAWQNCIGSAMQQQARADQSANAGLYLDAARRLEFCEREQPLALQVEQKRQAFRIAALKVSNYVKAGDLKSASQSLTALQNQYPGVDLLLSDGSSFITTMSLVTGQTEFASSAQLALLNAPSLLKRELQQL